VPLPFGSQAIMEGSNSPPHISMPKPLCSGHTSAIPRLYLTPTIIICTSQLTITTYYHLRLHCSSTQSNDEGLLGIVRSRDFVLHRYAIMLSFLQSDSTHRCSTVAVAEVTPYCNIANVCFLSLLAEPSHLSFGFLLPWASTGFRNE
jgi:hypothetical protein